MSEENTRGANESVQPEVEPVEVNDAPEAPVVEAPVETVTEEE